MSEQANGKSRSKGKGEFFAIDRRVWSELCNIGMNEAVAYLVMAQGTGRNNRSSSWSATSLHSYTGITWERAKRAIQRLIDNGFIRHGEKHSTARPRYDLLPWAEYFPERHQRKIDQLNAYEQSLLKGVRTHGDDMRLDKRKRSDLEKLVQAGFLRSDAPNKYTVVDPASDLEPDLIWLPNTIVTGTKNEEESPVGRLRGIGDPWILRLFVDLYHAQNLRDDCGISPRLIRGKYEPLLIGQQGIFNVWAFKQEGRTLQLEGPFAAHKSRPKKTPDSDHPVWESVWALERQGLLTFVPHMWENDSDQAEVIHAYGWRGFRGQHAGEDVEIKIGAAAYEAARAMALESRMTEAFHQGYHYLVPVKNSYPKVQMIGVARLTYRPHTSRTSAWFKDLKETSERWIAQYQTLAAEAQKVRAQTA